MVENTRLKELLGELARMKESMVDVKHLANTVAATDKDL